MKATVLTFLLAAFFAIPAFAQDADDRDDVEGMLEKRAQQISDMLTERLALSEEQREDVYEATEEMLEETTEDDDSRGEILKEYDEDMEDILNDEQYAQYMEGDLRKEMMEMAKWKAHNERMHK